MVIDRIEGKWAVAEIEEGRFERIPLNKFDCKLKEGMHFRIENGVYIRDLKSEKDASARIEALAKSVFE